MIWKKKEINTAEYLELKKDLEALRIKFEGMQLEFDLIIKKLKVKYKISPKDKEPEDLKNPMLLPES